MATTLSMTEISPSQISTVMVSHHDVLMSSGIRIVPMFWGGPGVGKTAEATRAARTIRAKHGGGGEEFPAGSELKYATLSQKDITDFGTYFPNRESRQLERFVTELLPVAERDGEVGVLMLDEFANASKIQQNIPMSLASDGFFDGYRLPAGWMLAGASNRASDRADITRMSGPTANRFAHYTVVPNHADLNAYLLAKGYGSEVPSYLEFTEGRCLNTFDYANKEQLSFATPRNWEKVAAMLPVVTDHRLLQTMTAAVMGDDVTTEFMGFLRIAHDAIPLRNEILSSPDTAAIPQQQNVRFAIVGALAGAAEPATIGNIYKYLTRWEAGEMMSVFFKQVIARFPKSDPADAEDTRKRKNTARAKILSTQAFKDFYSSPLTSGAFDDAKDFLAA